MVSFIINIGYFEFSSKIANKCFCFYVFVECLCKLCLARSVNNGNTPGSFVFQIYVFMSCLW